MYETSQYFDNKLKEKSRKYKWIGEVITKKAETIEFSDLDILKDSGYITNSCSGNNELELGAVYAAEMGITLLLNKFKNISFEEAKIKLKFKIENEEIPMGIFKIYEANKTKKFVELKGYDHMVKFEKNINFSETHGSIYQLIKLSCDKCKVNLGMSKEEIERLPNGKEIVGIYADNDIETYRDRLHYIGLVTATFLTIDRYGKLILKKFTTTKVYRISEKNRYDLSISDFLTKYSAIQTTNLKTKISEYYSNEIDEYLTMNLGVNPLMQLGLKEKRERMCKEILKEISKITYTPLDSLIVSNPKLDVGDVVEFIVENKTYQTIITTIEYKIHGKLRIKSVGQNYLLSKGKTKQDKNIQGILQTIDSDKLRVNSYTNSSEITLEKEPKTIIDIEFTSNKETDAYFIATIILNVKKETEELEETVLIKEDDKQKELKLIRTLKINPKIKINYYLNDEIIENHRPEETLISEKNTITLFYPIIKLKEKVLNRFNVEIQIDKGSVSIPLEGISSAIIGSSLGGDVEWNGKIKINEKITKIENKKQLPIPILEDNIESELIENTPYEIQETININKLVKNNHTLELVDNVEVEENNER
ncbi:hypothetical protein [Gemelliphila palaticanis]|uniref:Uncharacterized protein n=1 Tax=Gemelliphila palaticanis TaxID=81950 RepID=A0ABX2T1H7_9BACL|nr:hypothetical protein [Gemella palaticanis]MBF0714941.1 hypothetical protein [Gemella palaticanis]NYS46871.1 hypothetical protein [Gemella palaticanis]